MRGDQEGAKGSAQEEAGQEVTDIKDRPTEELLAAIEGAPVKAKTLVEQWMDARYIKPPPEDRAQTKHVKARLMWESFCKWAGATDVMSWHIFIRELNKFLPNFIKKRGRTYWRLYKVDYLSEVNDPSPFDRLPEDDECRRRCGLRLL